MTDRAPPRRVRVLFVCLGNICRSPTAEGVFRDMVTRAGLDSRVEIDSAGTGSWHVGRPPDRRSQAAAQRRNLDISAQRARQVRRDDLAGADAFDFVIAMDSNNLEDLTDLAGPEPAARARLRLLLRDFAPHLGVDNVPDPYSAGPNEREGFDHVFDLVTKGCEGLLAEVRARVGA